LTTYDVIKIDPFDIDDTTPTFIPITNIAPEVVPVDSPTTLAQSSP